MNGFDRFVTQPWQQHGGPGAVTQRAQPRAVNLAPCQRVLPHVPRQGVPARNSNEGRRHEIGAELPENAPVPGRFLQIH